MSGSLKRINCFGSIPSFFTISAQSPIIEKLEGFAALAAFGVVKD